MSAYTTQHLAGTKMGIFSLRTTFTQESAMGYIYLAAMCTRISLTVSLLQSMFQMAG